MQHEHTILLMCAQHSCAGGEYRHPDYTGTQIRATNEQKTWMNDWLVGTNMSMMLHRQGLRDAYKTSNLFILWMLEILGYQKGSQKVRHGVLFKTRSHIDICTSTNQCITQLTFFFSIRNNKKTKRQKKHFSQNRPIMISTRVTIVVWLHLIS